LDKRGGRRGDVGKQKTFEGLIVDGPDPEVAQTTLCPRAGQADAPDMIALRASKGKNL